MTTHTLNVTDGTTTLKLNDLVTTKTKTLSYIPGVSLSGDPIQETLQVHFYDTLANNLANLHTLNKLFEQARNYARTKTGARVYINFDPGDSGSVYRSLILDAPPAGSQEQTLGIFYTRERFTFEISWTRQPFWEGPLTQIPLTNMNGSNNTAGLTVNNVDDAAGDNFVTIAAVDVGGDLPAPIKVEMYNSYAAAAATDEINLFHNVHSTPASLVHILEGEDATGSGLSDQPEGTPGSSANYYTNISWSVTSKTKVATWALSSAQLGYAAGGQFIALARWNAVFPYTNVWLQLKLESATAVLWSGNFSLIPNTRELHWLDAIRLPPYLEGQSNLKGINLCLYAQRNQSGTHTIPLDYLMLAPVSGIGGWKRFVSVDQGIAYQEYFYHDDTEGFSYRVDTSSKKIAELSDYGGQILLIPGKEQRLYLVTCDTNGLALVEQTWTAKLWYRPRRSSL